jgi:hypothetical protein
VFNLGLITTLERYGRSLNCTKVYEGDDFEHTILKCADHLFDNQQFGEYKSLTRTYLLKQDTSQLPDIDVSTVKKYLLNKSPKISQTN